ncbi:MAG: Holliday junction branch migration protein RuvA [Clostridiales bacterium]|nr:Holliday junction branch migration protein RuvA [Clostridiales bacterium]MBQ3321834.1 Holliday junction branch migration protein RuvA [Bacillota bacterium]
MIGFLRGILADKGDGYIIIDVNGVGYQVFVPANTTAYLNAEGEEVLVYTSMIVREDDVSLFGFSGKGELDAFKKLIGISGVGPKAAISILSAFTLDQLKQAIVFEDAKALQRANGIGKKSAERIVLELKDKFTATAPDGSYLDTDAQSPAAIQGTRGEAISALVALGYSRGEASSALSSVTEKDLTTEEYIKRALKNLF